jgi:hypothetical protein
LSTGEEFHFEVKCYSTVESNIEPSIIILFLVAVFTISTAAFTSNLEIFDDLSEEE